jgi:hypothetical protein
MGLRRRRLKLLKKFMKEGNEKIKKSVNYKVIIKSKEGYFNIGTIVIRTYTGDILYTPSTRFLDDPNNITKKEIDHVSWHASGRVSIKYKGNREKEYSIIQERSDRQKISEIGFQKILKDTIKDFHKLPKHLKQIIPLDVVLNVGDYSGPVLLDFSMVSGKLIAAKYEGQSVPIKLVNIKKGRGRFDSTIRALGHHSGSSDVILQYSLRRAKTENLQTNRQIFIPHDMRISKLNVRL